MKEGTIKVANLKKTILAVTIAAAAQSALAVPIGPLDVPVTGLYKQSVTGTMTDLTLSGSGTVIRFLGENGVDITRSTIGGNVANNANISVYGNDLHALGFTDTNVGGSITNNGALSTNQGTSGLGIGLTRTTAGDLINKGSIRINNQLVPGTFDVNRGIMIDGGSHLTGSVINDAMIQIDGANSEGINISSADGASPAATTKIDGDVINNVTVNTAGSNSRAITMKNVDFGNSVINNGVISTVGGGTTGILMDNTDFDTIQNNETMRIRGQDSVAINVVNSTGKNIINKGHILSDGVGIQVKNDNPETLYTITQDEGSIGGATKSIDGNNQTNVNLNGGTILGDMFGIKTLAVAGDVTVDADNIQALLVDVKTNQLYLARLNTNVSGDLTVRSLAALQLRLSDSTDANTAIAKVGGKATFESGSQVRLTANEGDFKQVDGTKYTLVSANQLVNNGLTVTSDSALITVKSFKVEGDQLTAILGSATPEEVEHTIELVGGSANAASALKPFTEVLKGMDVNDPLYKQFVSADPETLKKLAEQLSPEVNGGAFAAASNASGMASKATAERVRSIGANSGDVLNNAGAWIKVLTADASQGTRNQISGYDADSSGVIIGADGKLNDFTTLGVAYSYIQSDVNSNNGNKTDVTTNLFTGYGGWEKGPINVDGSITFGKSDNDSKRYIGNSTAKGSYDSDLFALDVTAGYRFPLNHSLTIEPLVGGRYTNVETDSFSEKGSPAALSTGSQRLEKGELGFGVRADGSYPVGKGLLKPTARVMAYHDFIQDSTATTSAFVLGGTTFLSTGASPTSESYEAGLGLDYSVGKVTVGAAYDYATQADFHADAFSIRARYDF
jgi:outer membrane autotransporter protein